MNTDFPFPAVFIRTAFLHVLTIIAILPLFACSVTDMQRGESFDGTARWVLLPVQNHSGMPQAGEQVTALLGAVLRTRGLAEFEVPPDFDSANAPLELDEGRRYERSLEWARKNNFVLGITGSVEEWRYKSGAEGEPAVALNVKVVNIANGRVMWSAVGGRSGWGRETLSGTGQKLLRQLLVPMQIKNDRNEPR
jgi:hypothetical protein